MAQFISVSGIKDSLTECQICTEQFDDTKRIPLRMPCCVQSICQQCLETYIKGRQIMSCPMCKHQHQLPDGVNSLPKEPVILKILDHLKIKKGIRLPCTDCPDKQSAVAQCDNCGIFLCTTCLNAHTRNKVTKNHTTVTFEEMKDRPVESFRRHHECTEHQQPLQFFCYTCRTVICVSCTVVEHRQGKEHDVASLDEAHKDRTSSTNAILSKLEEKAQNLDDSNKKLQEKRKNIHKSTENAIHDINKTFDELYEGLLQRRLTLLSDVDKKSKEDLKLTEEALDSTNTLHAKVTSSVGYIRQMQSKADKIEDIQLMVSSADTLYNLLQESSQGVPFEKAGVCFVPANFQHLSTILKGTGLIRGVKYLAIFKPLHQLDFHDSITLTPAEFPAVSYPKEMIAAGKGLTFPSLEWDKSTAGLDVTIAGSVVENTAMIPSPPPDTGCRLQASYHVMVSSPLIVRKGERVMFNMKINFSVNEIQEDWPVFECALTNSPVDSLDPQATGLRTFVRLCSNHEDQLCLRIKYDDNRLADIPVSKPIPRQTCELYLSFILDGDTNKIHVIDADAVKMISSVPKVVFDKPLWIVMCLSPVQFSEVKAELISDNTAIVSQKMNKLLSSHL